MNVVSTDRIHKQMVINAPRSRVWAAVADARRFGAWFGVELDGPFAPGARVHGRVIDPQYAHAPFNLTVEQVQPERLIAWRWHPYSIEPGVDYSDEPTTRVVFELEEHPQGTLLTVVESGFDALPPERRGLAYRANEGGWDEQLQAVARYVAESHGD